MSMQTQQPTQSAPAPALTDSDADIEEGAFVIPPSLRDEPVFFVFSFRDRDGTRAKVPCDASSVRAKSVNGYEPPTTVTFEEAHDLVTKSRERYSGRNQLDGIMLSLVESGLTCIDLDDVVDPDTGEADQWAVDLVNDCDSYAEISSSSTGLHIFLDDDAGLAPEVKKAGKIEVYDERGIAVTFRHVVGTPETLNETNGLTQAYQRQYNNSGQTSSSSGSSGSSSDETAEYSSDDYNDSDELNEKQEQLISAIEEYGDDMTQLLWTDGDSKWEQGDFKSRSEADFRLLQDLLFWAEESRVLKPYDYTDEELVQVYLLSDLAQRPEAREEYYAPLSLAEARRICGY